MEPGEALAASLAGAVSRNETEPLPVWPYSACAGQSHLDDEDTEEEEENKQLGKFSLLKCFKGVVAILSVGMVCQFVSRALNFPAS